jgi:hypothetical protein
VAGDLVRQTGFAHSLEEMIHRAIRIGDGYRAQRAWLALFGRTLEQEFDIDPMTVLVRTNCLN